MWSCRRRCWNLSTRPGPTTRFRCSYGRKPPASSRSIPSCSRSTSGTGEGGRNTPGCWPCPAPVGSRAPDRVVNLHRFGSMAWLAGRVGAANTAVFEGTRLEGRRGVSAWPHAIGDGRHETERNHALIADIAGPFDLPPGRVEAGRRHEAGGTGLGRGGHSGSAQRLGDQALAGQSMGTLGRCHRPALA